MTGHPPLALLRKLTPEHGWHGELVRDARGEPVAVVAVRVGARWTDSVAIAGENETLAMRHRTHDDRVISPIEPPSESCAVWHRHGRCDDVLAELLELPTET
jgi:hypothetical protein